MSKSVKPADDGWVSRWERQQAWSATFGNRSDLAWPYSSTPIKHVLGEPPALRAQLGEVFAEAVDSTTGLVYLIASLLATITIAVMTTVAATLPSPVARVALVSYPIALAIAALLAAVANLAPAGSRVASRLAHATRPALAMVLAATAAPLAVVVLGGPAGWILLGLAFPTAIAIALTRRPGAMWLAHAAVATVAIGFAAALAVRAPALDLVLLFAGGVGFAAATLAAPAANRRWLTHALVTTAAALHAVAILHLCLSLG